MTSNHTAGRERRAAARDEATLAFQALRHAKIEANAARNQYDRNSERWRFWNGVLQAMSAALATDATSAAAISDQTAYIALTAIDVFLAEADRKHDWSEYEAARADLQRVVDAGASAAAGSVAVNENELIKMVAELLYRYRPTKNNQEDAITDAERAVRRLIERSAAESAEASGDCS